MTEPREIGTWWIDHFEDPREELLCLQWLRARVYGWGRDRSGRLFFRRFNDPRVHYLSEVT